MTVKAYIYKEITEHLRKYRLFTLGALTLILAFSSPVILYFLPKIIANQTQSPMDLSTLFQVGQIPAIQSYIGDMYEIAGVLIIIFCSGLLLNEIKSQSIVIPFTNGLKPKQMIITKYLVYVTCVGIITFIGFVVNHYYSGLVFKSFDANISLTLNAYVSYMAFVSFHIALAICISQYTRNLFATIVLTLMSYFIMPGLFELMSIKISMYQLTSSFQLIPFSNHLTLSLITTLISIVILLYISTRKRIEL